MYDTWELLTIFLFDRNNIAFITDSNDIILKIFLIIRIFKIPSRFVLMRRWEDLISRRIRISSTLALSRIEPCSSTILSISRSSCPKISIDLAHSLNWGLSISNSLKNFWDYALRTWYLKYQVMNLFQLLDLKMFSLIMNEYHEYRQKVVQS